MANSNRSLYTALLTTLIVMGVALAGQAARLPQQPAQSQQAAAYQAPADVKAPPADAEKTKSGLASKVIKPGTGTEKPGPIDKVTVNYTGWTSEGKMFDSTIARNKPSTFIVGNVLPGWVEGLQLMVVG